MLARAGLSRRDHPRVRGEHIATHLPVTDETGSSPRARGARGATAQDPPGAGIIPACAGSTDAEVLISAVEEDHPRVRGEHGASSDQLSNPRWIIPACAGSTW